MTDINESEKKRIESLKRQKENFKNKEKAIQNALKNLDNKSNKNKIVFDDDIDKIDESKIEKKKKKKNSVLFHEDDDDDDKNDFDHDFELKTDKSGKILKRAITLGNDKRFKLDEKFMENDNKLDKNSLVHQNAESDLRKEKDIQLGILEDILGVPINKKPNHSNKERKTSKKEMIRYDPTISDHKEYEIVQKTEELNTKQTKKKKKIENIENVNENPPVEVSKDVYFSVSESLSKSLKTGGQFSLLKTYGREESTEQAKNIPNEGSLGKQNFKLKFDAKNPFKYDSSDSEDDKNNDKNNISLENKTVNNDSWESNNFFFVVNDTRFKEAEKFFSKESTTTEQFENLRRQLKQIVRSKIKKNVRKHEPWGRKRKIKRIS